MNNYKFIYTSNIYLHKVAYMFRPLGLNKWRKTTQYKSWLRT